MSVCDAWVYVFFVEDRAVFRVGPYSRGRGSVYRGQFNGCCGGSGAGGLAWVAGVGRGGGKAGIRRLLGQWGGRARVMKKG